MDREKSGCDTVENSGCGEEKGRGHREVAVVIVTATTFQVTERSFPLSCLCAKWRPFQLIETGTRIHCRPTNSCIRTIAGGYSGIIRGSLAEHTISRRWCTCVVFVLQTLD